jgi:leucyl aminopeptidase
MTVDVTVEQGDVTAVTSEAIVVNLFEGVDDPGGATEAVDDATDGAVQALVDRGDFEGGLEETATVYPDDAPFDRVVLVGLGEADDLTLDRVRRAAAAAAREARGLDVASFHTIVHGAGAGGLGKEAAAQAVAEGSALALYEFDRYESEDDEDDAGADLEEVVVVERSESSLEAVEAGVDRGQVVAESTNYTRDLATTSGDDADPAEFARRARELAAETDLTVDVLDEAALEDGGFGGILGVARGSAREPRLVRLEHDPGGEAPTVVLAGKGVTFDTGGISIKPSSGMDDMRYDKSAACTVYGVLRAAALLDVDVHVVGLTPWAENMPGGAAIKPGDVLDPYGGTTIEVLNTDAEGRLLLADTLAYADELDPDAVVDLATLTGSIGVALGDQASGLMGTDEDLMEAIEEAAEATRERVWRLPFYDEYDEQLASDVADVQNVGGKKAGAITAGKFLDRHTGDYPWAHLDIAGTAFQTGGGPEYNPAYSPADATGAGVRLLVRLLRDWDEGTGN